MEKVSLMIVADDCTGCHACEVACKQEHGIGVGPRLIRVIENSPVYIPVYCHHCAKPPCGDACPVEAITRNGQGIVLINEELCIGCRACVDACPFGAMQYDEDRDLAVKCGLCIDRLQAGEEPACKKACPSHCILVGDMKGFSEEIDRRLARR